MAGLPQFQDLNCIIIGGFLASWQSWRQHNMGHTQGHHGSLCLSSWLTPQCQVCLQAANLYILFFLPYLLWRMPNQLIFFIKSDNLLGFKRNLASCQGRVSEWEVPSCLKQPKNKTDKTYETTFFKTLDIRRERGVTNQASSAAAQGACLRRDSKPRHNKEESRWNLANSMN